jgi:hypothetical protein
LETLSYHQQLMEPDDATRLPGAGTVSERRHSNVSFLDLPRELREMIYKHIPHNTGAFTYDTNIETKNPSWSPMDVGSCQEGSTSTFEEKYGNPGITLGAGEHYFAILSTCRTIYLEARSILYAATPLGIWRPMYDYGGASKYPVFIEKAFTSLPTHASQHIRILQLQGELWHNNMATLLNTALAKLSSLKILEIGLDPYYDTTRRRYWFDDRVISRQAWPAISTLHIVAQHLTAINITISPPSNKVYKFSSSNEDQFCLSGSAYQHFLWLRLHLSVFRYELSIYGALVHRDAKQGMESFMDLLMQREDLFELFQRRRLVEGFVAGTAKFELENEREWLRGITGRSFKIDKEQRRIDVFSEGEAEVKWCKFSYEMKPRGLVE